MTEPSSNDPIPIPGASNDVGAWIAIARHQSDTFTDASHNDMLMFPTRHTQRMLMGPNLGGAAALVLGSNQLHLRGDLVAGAVHVRGLQISANNGSMNDPAASITSMRGVSNVGNGNLLLHADGPAVGATSIRFAMEGGRQELARLTGNGRLGLGTPTPAHTLDVRGDIHFTGHLLHQGAAISTWEGGEGGVGMWTPSNVAFGAPPDPSHRVLCFSGDTSNASASLSNPTGCVQLFTSGAHLGVSTPSPTYPLHVGISSNNVSIYAAADVVCFSDARFKTDVVPITDALRRVHQLRGYTFQRSDTAPGARRMAGLLAQEVRKVLPEVVGEDADGKLSIAYGNVSALLVEALRELALEVADLRARVHGQDKGAGP
jgi:hypothetical protein